MLWEVLTCTLGSHIKSATQNDIDLLAEVQMFWHGPAFRFRVLSDYNISSIALGVVHWLQVRPIPLPN